VLPRGGCWARLEMERWFFVEAKTFMFSIVKGASVLRLEERRRGFSGVVFLGSQCTAWLASTVVELTRLPSAKEFIKSFREGPKVLIVRSGGNNSDQFLEVEVYVVGSWKGLILIPEGREEQGCCRFAAKLSKVKLLFVASVGFKSGNSSSAEKNKVVPGLALGSIPTSGQGAFGEVGALSFVEVLRSEASPSTTMDFLTVRLDDPLGKDHFAIGNPLCKASNTKQSSSVQGNVACLPSVADEGEGSLLGKGILQSLVWAWKGHLVNLKIEVDRALRFIHEGQLCWVEQGGKKWAPKRKPMPKFISKPILGSEVELKFLSECRV